jgi:hypothetical protein
MTQERTEDDRACSTQTFNDASIFGDDRSEKRE